MALDFPNTPTNGSTFVGGLGAWQWDGAKWNPQAATTGYYLPLTGGTLTGPLVLSGNATASLNPVTLQQLTSTVGAYLPLTGGTLTGLLTMSSATNAQINFLNTSVSNTAGGLWRTYVGTLGNYNITMNTAAAGDFSTQIAHVMTHTGAVGINYAPPSDASAGQLFISNPLIGLGGSVLFANVYIASGGGSKMIATGAGSAFNMGNGGFQFYSTPSAAAGASIVGWVQIASVDTTGNFLSVGNDPSQQLTWGAYGKNTIRFVNNSGDESNAGCINYRGVGGSDALNIIGAGPASTGVRLVRIYDQLQVQYNGANALFVAGNTQVNGNFCCGGYLSTAVGQIVSMGSTAGFIFMDRSGSPQWQWYASGNVARLWNSGSGDRVTVDSNGALTNTGYMTANDFRSNTNVYIPNGYCYAGSYIQAAGNFYVGGMYIYQAGGGGSVNASGGPFIYADSSNTVLHVGSGNGNVYMQNNAGRQTGGWRSDGWVTSFDNRPCIMCDGSYNRMENGTGDGAGLYIGGSNDRTNFYRNGNHQFQNSEPGGTQNFAYINSTTIYSYNQINSAQYMLTSTYMQANNSGTAMYTPNGNVVTNTCSANNFNNTSDIALKTDIADLPECLDLVTAISPRRFRWRQGPDTEISHWGFVAQDVEAVMTEHDFGGVTRIPQHPEHVGPVEHLGLAYNELTAMLWKAVQELAAEVATLKGKT